jgi:hypothetical protein
MHNAHQHAAIHPDQAAIVAGIDNRVARTGIEVRIHRMMALRAIDLAAQIFFV